MNAPTPLASSPISRLVLAFTLATFAGGCANETGPPFDHLVEAIEYEREAKGLPAFSISVTSKAGTLFEAGFGEAREGVPASGETVYRVASISKLFTALAVAELAANGELDLDAPLDRAVPEVAFYNPYAVDLTLRQVLSHQSGLIREPPVGSYFDDTTPSLRATVGSLTGSRVALAPMTTTKYSNAAVSLAGLAVENATGRPFAEHVQERLLDRFGMESSGFARRDDFAPMLAEGVMWGYDDRDAPAPDFDLGISPAAGLYTTTSDLAQFGRILLQEASLIHRTDTLQIDARRNESRVEEEGRGRLFPVGFLDTLWTVQYPYPGQTAGFGLGFFVSSVKGLRALRHNGVMYGQASEFIVLPEADLAVAAVGTRDATNAVVTRLAEYALALAVAYQNDLPLPEYERTDPVPAELARSLAGHYVRVDDSLTASALAKPHAFLVGSDRVEVTARPEGLFLFDGRMSYRLGVRGDTLVADDRLTYGDRIVVVDTDELDAEGQPLRQFQTPRGRFYRVASPRPPAPDASLDELIGEYGWAHNTLYVYERDGAPWALIEWFFHYPLERLGTDTLALPTDGLYAGERFAVERDSTGRIGALSLEGLRWPRRMDRASPDRPFRIPHYRPLDDVLEEAAVAQMPHDADGYEEPDLVDLRALDPSIQFDIRYATASNFMGAPLYPAPRAYLQREAADALLRAHTDLARHGLGLIVFDAYRPWHVTKAFWEATPPDLRAFVADPDAGSSHNRGCAIDVGLYDRATGQPLIMPSDYDEFTDRAFADYPGGTSQSRWLREHLRTAMDAEGFRVYSKEWWHFSHPCSERYPVMNVALDAL